MIGPLSSPMSALGCTHCCSRARPGDKPADDKSLFAAPPERQSTVRTPVDLSGLAPQSGNLFVHRIAEFQPQ